MGAVDMIPSEYLNQIVTGDARELARAIPDESVDLIFTDPVYEAYGCYETLAEIARRVLRPHGKVLCWSNGKWHRQNATWLEQNGLRYRWDFAYVITGGAAPMNGKIIAKTNRLIWLDLHGTSVMSGYLADGYAGVTWSRPNTHNHKWTKSPKYTGQALNAFSYVCDVVLDPFTGGGTVPAVCKMLGRNFVAFEIDPGTAQMARLRVEQTQVPLPGLLEEQQELAI